jgi:hypothetical protein
MIVRSKSTDFSEWPPSLRSAAGRSFSEWGAAFAALGSISANGYFSAGGPRTRTLVQCFRLEIHRNDRYANILEDWAGSAGKKR